ncbi:glycoside hydrolase family 5 [Spirochaeta thermophila DSM 6578]|uniref:Glycoside hydrolase family 5 n=1 Tax=Winmispira thermophila (strain ATCC 700085 / DSM 6578 / Z-1203) TaxID=869211 RepID=G0GB31_WINT7|nr:glycoside hydrolase family 5 protein [Spirochaeta thermophila]AEJ61055.1 glycoside hydrolase family 5 [Spirochaeta thermophila DSM 6578]
MKRKWIIVLAAVVVLAAGVGVGLSLATGGSVVDRHGMLQVRGNAICDAHGRRIQLRGMSLFWSQWSAPFWNPELVRNLARTWKVSLIRAAMGVENAYLTSNKYHKNLLIKVVDAAIEEGIYVIIDWHSHNIYLPQAEAFFAEMAERYGNVPNVIFEIYNEPDTETWDEIKAYAVRIIETIRSRGAKNLIVVGTPHWSQDVDVAADDPITGYENIAYTLHFYAGTHREELREKARYALSKGLPIFVTEWGTCEASGDGPIDVEESERWLAFLDEHMISWANWAMNDKRESASVLVFGASTTGPWPDDQLTESGRFVKAKIMEAPVRVGERVE